MKVSIRSMIVAPPGKILVSVDLSQAESWVVAHLAREKNMQYSLKHSDIHLDSAAALFHPDNFCVHSWSKLGDDYVCEKCQLHISKSERYIGKQFNHATSYRMKPPRAAQVINKQSDRPPFVTVALSESKTYYERWHQRYNVKLWWKEIEEELSKSRSLTTPYGRRRVFFGQWGEELFKEATAFTPQSTVADHANGMVQQELGIEGGIYTIWKKLINPYKDRALINQSHDSFVAEVPEVGAKDFAIEAKNLMVRPLIIHGVQFTIPGDCEIGTRLGELEKLT